MFGIGRALKKGIKSIGKELERGVESVGREIERTGSKILSEKYKSELRRVRDTAVNAAGFLGPTTAIAGGPTAVAASTYLGYEETVAEDEERAYQRQSEREAAQRAKAEAERGQERLRRRRMRRLGTPAASGFGSASTGYKTVLGI